ncbi:MAG: glycoside hydrolase family 15 protein [Actinomycetota bacterium]|nr:glycoside hydrolase family 15 protein [Actinomycetota bacterium]
MVRVAGYAPIADYAAIGDGRTVALVAKDGAIDWLCLPNLDSPTVFAALLDVERGGSFSLQPAIPFRVQRRYEPETNVLETTFTTGDGIVRVTDAMLLPAGGLVPFRELVRRIEWVAGRVPMRWRVEPRFNYGRHQASIRMHGGVPVAAFGSLAIGVCAWGAGRPYCELGRVCGQFELTEGQRALLVLTIAYQEPLIIPTPAEVEARLEATRRFWRRWAADRRYGGPWRDAVIRSALALKLLFHAPSGAIAAAATASLPEHLGGQRNWDYRFSWVRDAAFTLNALFNLGCVDEAESFFWWLLHASQLTHPKLSVLYRLDGGVHAPERTLPLAGYRGSRPVRVGNEARRQRQLDVYGEFVQTAWLYRNAAGQLDTDIAKRLAETADLVCSIWREPDSGIWEVRNTLAHFTQSKMMCRVALDRAVVLAEDGCIPDRHVTRWRAEAAAIHDFVERNCWSERLGSYTQSAGSQELDASLLLGALMGYHDPRHPRMASTIEVLRQELGRGALLYRYTGDDGLSGREGAFTCCSFWLSEALARGGRTDPAAELMEQLIGLANDVGLYAEEIHPESGEFLGNIPQALVHLALISAVTAIAKAEQ